MRSRCRPLLLTLAFLCAMAQPQAAEPRFTVKSGVDSTSIGTQDTLEYEVEVEGTGFRAVDPPDLTELEGWEVLDGPRRVQRQSIVNGQFSAAVQLLWTLGPRRAGRLTIPAMAMRVDGQPFRTDPIDVQVVKGSVAARLPSSSGTPGAGEVLLVADVDKRRAYVGEQITFTLRLLTQLGVRGMAYQTRAEFNGFWAEKEFDYVDDPPGRIEGNQIVHEGKPFNEYVLARVALFPTASGSLQIEPINLQLRVRAERNDRFSSFFFDREKTQLRRSARVQVEVLPLPVGGRPDSFSGAVGEFRLQVETDRSESVVNDAVSLHVEITGDGNIRSVGDPTLPPLADFRQFEPTVNETHRFRKARYGGSRTWEYVLVPLAPGDQSLPPITFSYFDPGAGKYRTLRSESIPLRIARGEGPELPNSVGLSRREVTALRQDIHFIKLAGGDLTGRGNSFHTRGAYLALLAMPLFLNAALLVWRLRADRLRLDVARRRSLGARRAFRVGMAEAKAARAADDPAGFHAAVAGAVTGLLADKCNLAPAGLTRGRIRSALEHRGVEEEMRSRVEEVLDVTDAARFAAAQRDPAEEERLLQRVDELGRRLESIR